MQIEFLDVGLRVFFKKAGKVEAVCGFGFWIIVSIASMKAEKRLRRKFRLFGTRGKARVSLEIWRSLFVIATMLLVNDKQKRRRIEEKHSIRTSLSDIRSRASNFQIAFEKSIHQNASSLC